MFLSKPRRLVAILRDFSALPEALTSLDMALPKHYEPEPVEFEYAITTNYRQRLIRKPLPESARAVFRAISAFKKAWARKPGNSQEGARSQFVDKGRSACYILGARQDRRPYSSVAEARAGIANGEAALLKSWGSLSRDDSSCDFGDGDLFAEAEEALKRVQAGAFGADDRPMSEGAALLRMAAEVRHPSSEPGAAAAADPKAIVGGPGGDPGTAAPSLVVPRDPIADAITEIEAANPWPPEIEEEEAEDPKPLEPGVRSSWSCLQRREGRGRR